MTDTQYGKTEIGSSSIHKSPKAKRGWSLWIENGVWFTAPTVKKTLFGSHRYDYGDGTGHCDCGCYMGGCSSSGPVDPFGKCPLNPKTA